MGIISWIIFGLIAGFIASKIVNKTGSGTDDGYRARRRRRDRRRIPRELTPRHRRRHGFNIWSIIIAVIGAVIVLWSTARSSRGPDANRQSAALHRAADWSSSLFDSIHPSTAPSLRIARFQNGARVLR